jgi:hypothetical protein
MTLGSVAFNPTHRDGPRADRYAALEGCPDDPQLSQLDDARRRVSSPDLAYGRYSYSSYGGKAMALAVGILLAAIGAVTAFAWDPGHLSTYGVDVHAAGVILLVGGIAGVLLALVSEYSVTDRDYFARRRTTTEVNDDGGRVSRREVLRQM